MENPWRDPPEPCEVFELRREAHRPGTGARRNIGYTRAALMSARPSAGRVPSAAPRLAADVGV